VSRAKIEALLVALATLALIVLIGRDLWVRHTYGERSPEYRALTHEPGPTGRGKLR